MRTLTLDELDEESAAFDDAVAATTDIDQFCSSSDWVIPAARALTPGRASWIARAPEGYLALMESEHPAGFPLLHPLEAMWGLACPIVGHEVEALVARVVDWTRARGSRWRVMLISGVPVDSALMTALVRGFGSFCELRPGTETVRHVADLEGGVDGFLSRRSRNFRKALRQKLRAVADVGVSFEIISDADPEAATRLYERILAVERKSWKGRHGVGIDGGRMCDFYRVMVPRLAARGALRVLLARAAEPGRAGTGDNAEGGDSEGDGRGRLVAYVLGGVVRGTYRGLQFSFDDSYRALGLGNVCQYQQIRSLCAEGVQSYDLGIGMEYKRRWAEIEHTTAAVVVING